MRFLFKTAYEQDIRLFRDGTTAAWYGVLAVIVLALPVLLSRYYIGEITWVFIYGICGVSLMVLVGYTGLLSLGHAAFLGIGAYAHAYFLQHGVPWVASVALAVLITTACGIIVGLPALRMTGIYLAIATLAFAVIIQEVFTRWEAVTGGFAGMAVDKPVIFGLHFNSEASFYYLCAATLALTLLLTQNLLRSSTGRAWVAIRDSEIAAQSMGVHLPLYKSVAFAYSAAVMGLAGALFAHKIAYLAPDIFSILFSIQLLLLVIVGGLGSLHGSCVRRDFRGPAAANHRHPARRDPGHHGQLRKRHRHRRDRHDRPRDRRVPEEARRRGRHFWPDPGAGDPGRAGRHVWPLGQAQALLLDVSDVQARQLQAAEELHALGASAMTFFRAENLAINFGGIRAVDNVSFAVEKGEVFTIIGPNGAGKTTIFNLVSRIYQPSAGRLLFEDRDITATPPHRIAELGIARTFQNIELFEHATLLQNLLLARHVHRNTGFFSELLFLPSVRRMEIEHREAVEKVIDFLDLQQYRDALVVNLPYGVRKIVELARALSTDPRLLLLDEPSSGLNVEETDDMAFWIEDIKNVLGISVLMVEHDMKLVTTVSDRVLALNYGRPLATGTPQEVQSHPEVIRAYLGA